MSRAAVTKLERAAEEALALQEIERAEWTVAELPARLSQARSLEAQAMMLHTAIDLVRQLIAKRDAGVQIPDDLVASAFDALEDGCDRMIELMPPERRRP